MNNFHQTLAGKSTTKNKFGAIVIEGHVQGLSNTRSLGEAGIPVYVVDKTNCIARYSRYCKKFFICPDFILDSFVEFLIDLAKDENIKSWVLIPSNDHAVYTISKFKTKLEEYYNVITPTISIIDKIYDKINLLEVAKTNDVPVPLTQLFTNKDEPLAEELEYPVITKGRNGLSFYKTLGKKAYLAKSEKELRSQLKLIQEKYSIRNTFTQEVISDNGDTKTISFTAFCVGGAIKSHWSGMKIREHPLRFGTATFVKSIYSETCLKQSIPLLKALNYTGVCEIEYLKDPRNNQYKLIEINPRTWLWVGLARSCGIDYARMIYNYFSHEELRYPMQNECESYWINPVTDFLYSILAMIKGHLTPYEYFRSIQNKKLVNALFIKNDLKPGIVYIIKSLSFVRKR